MLAFLLKLKSVVLTYVVVGAFYLNLLPPYFTFTPADTKLWMLFLTILSAAQTALLFKLSILTARAWSDLLLQLTGIMFIGLTGIFGAEYPPFSWAMAAFPLLGALYLVAGRALGQRTRKQSRELNGTNKPD